MDPLLGKTLGNFLVQEPLGRGGMARVYKGLDLSLKRPVAIKSGRNWRAGLESRISLLKRRYGLHRCRYQGEAGNHRWVGWGVIAYDLQLIARKLAS